MKWSPSVLFLPLSHAFPSYPTVCPTPCLLLCSFIKPFSYSSRSVSQHPPVPCSLPSYWFKSMTLHKPFLPPLTLNTTLSRSLNTFPSSWVSPSLSLSLNTLAPVSLSVISVGQLVCFYKNFLCPQLAGFSNVRWKLESSFVSVFFFFLFINAQLPSLSHTNTQIQRNKY